MEKVNWNRRSYTEDEFRNAWIKAKSVTECARNLGLNIYGSTHHTLKETAKSLYLNKDHFTGSGWRKGNPEPIRKKQPLEFYLVENKKVSTANIKKRLVNEGFLSNKCYAPFCPVPNPSINPFTGEPTALKLALDHINGNNMDNRLENLRLLCYHCHGETDTWCGKDRQKDKPTINGNNRCHCGKKKDGPARQCISCHRQEINANAEPPKFCGCGKKISRKSIKCKSCTATVKNMDNRKIMLSPQEILDRINTGETYSSIGREQSCSGGAIQKFLVRNGIIPPKSSNKKRTS